MPIVWLIGLHNQRDNVMSYRSVLVDKARAITYTRGTRGIEGESLKITTYGKWFSARLVPAGSKEVRANNRSSHETKETQLLYAVGGSLHINDKVEVTSRELGTAVWIVMGEPQPVRKKRVLLGYIATIRISSDV